MAKALIVFEYNRVPDIFKCPICMELPLGEVYQCKNGHPICNECQEKSERLLCSQCNKSMRTGDGDWIRNRFMEQLLEGLRIACPFDQDGCEETFPQGDIEKHKENCSFKCVQICKYFNGTGKTCPYSSQLSNPEETMSHLKTHLHVVTDDYEGDEVAEQGGDWWWWISVGQSQIRNTGNVEAVVTRENGGVFMTIAWISKETEPDQIQFACLRMNKSVAGRKEPKAVKLTLECQQDKQSLSLKMPDIILTIPIVSVQDAEPFLEQKPVTVSRVVLEKYYLKNENVDEEYESCVKVILNNMY